jgi:hypothetical protein
MEEVWYLGVQEMRLVLILVVVSFFFGRFLMMTGAPTGIAFFSSLFFRFHFDGL